MGSSNWLDIALYVHLRFHMGIQDVREYERKTQEETNIKVYQGYRGIYYAKYCSGGWLMIEMHNIYPFFLSFLVKY